MNTKVEKFKIIEVRPGVYLRYGTNGCGELTDDISQAKRYAIDDFGRSSRVADKWFGEVKELKITSEVE